MKNFKSIDFKSKAIKYVIDKKTIYYYNKLKYVLNF